MNLLANVGPPAPPRTRDSGSVAIGLHVGIDACPVIWPPSNFSGAKLLLRLLNMSLASRGLLAGAGNCAGPLNDVVCLWFVSDRAASLRVLRTELACCWLLPFAQFAWFDVAEGVWRDIDRPDGAPLFQTYCEPARLRELTGRILDLLEALGWPRQQNP